MLKGHVSSPLAFQDVQMRLVCTCGNCTATVLVDDAALDLHQKLVTGCINNANLQEIQSVANRWSPAPHPPFSLRLPPSFRPPPSFCLSPSSPPLYPLFQSAL